MSPQALHIKKLVVSKMPGFSEGLRIPQQFSAHLNIVTGPNASGKSSVARAIQKVIWPAESRDFWLKAEALVGKEEWLFEVNQGFSESQRNGQKQTLQSPVAEERHRYLLALHELIKADDSELAEEIQRQLSGGYDLDAAARSGGFNDSISTKSLAEYKALDAARKKVQELTRDQKNLHEEQERLQTLRKELEVKNEELRKEKFFELALQHRVTSSERETAKSHLETFPAVLKNLATQDLSQVENCELELTDAENEIRTAEAQLQELGEEMKQLGLPESGLSETQEDQMASLLSEMESLTKSQQTLNSDLLSAREELKNAAENLQLKDPDAEWAGLKITAVKPLEESWQKAYQELAAHAALEKEIESLKKRLDSFSNPIPDRDDLVQGIRNLTRWLQEQQGQSEPGIPSWSLYALGLLAIAGTVVALFVNWTGWGVLIAALAGIIVFLALRKNQSAPSGNASDTYKRDFEKSGLSGPAGWSPEDVAEYIAKLSGELMVAAEKSAFDEQLSRRINERQEVKSSLEQFRAKLNETRDALGLLPIDADSENIGAMYWFLSNASKWQKARDTRDGASAELREVEQAIEAKLESFNELLNDLELDRINDFATARTISERLRRAEQKRREAEVQMGVARRLKAAKSTDCEKLNKKVDAVYERMQIEGRDKHQLQVLHNQFEDFKEAEKQVDISSRKADDYEKALREHPLYESEHANLETWSSEELEQRINAFSEIKNRRDQLNNEIGGIVALVNKRRSGNDLESALNEEDSAYENL